MGFRILYDVTGDEAVEHDLLAFADRAADAAPAFREIVKMCRAIEAEWFASEGDGTWDALAESTVAAKASAGLRPEILRATDDLFESLTEDGAAGAVEVITPIEMAWGSSIPYAKWHSSGTSRMPARDPLGITELHLREFTRTIQAWLVGAEATAMRAGGGGNIPFGVGVGPFP